MQIRTRLAMAALVFAIGTPMAHAAGVTAGTTISNTATVTYVDPDVGPQTVNSNPSSFTVDELLDVVVTRNDAGNVLVVSPQTDVPLSYTVTNTGNGSEPMRLSFDDSLGGDNFDPTGVTIYVDDGDGVFDPLVDTLYVPTINDPVLAPDASVVVFVVSDIPAALANGDLGNVLFSAEAVTSIATLGDDAPGTTFAGMGTTAGPTPIDAVVGATGAYDEFTNGYRIAQVFTTFDKSYSILDPFGGSSPVPGAIITYTLTFTVTGSGDVTSVLITDPIPANTTYVPGTLTLNGNPLTDPIDAELPIPGSFRDLGGFMGIHVDLGTVSAAAAPGTVNTITFDVRVDCQTAPGMGNQCNVF